MTKFTQGALDQIAETVRREMARNRITPLSPRGPRGGRPLAFSARVTSTGSIAAMPTTGGTPGEGKVTLYYRTTGGTIATVPNTTTQTAYNVGPNVIAASEWVRVVQDGFGKYMVIPFPTASAPEAFYGSRGDATVNTANPTTTIVFSLEQTNDSQFSWLAVSGGVGGLFDTLTVSEKAWYRATLTADVLANSTSGGLSTGVARLKIRPQLDGSDTDAFFHDYMWFYLDDRQSRKLGSRTLMFTKTSATTGRALTFLVDHDVGSDDYTVDASVVLQKMQAIST